MAGAGLRVWGTGQARLPSMRGCFPQGRVHMRTREHERFVVVVENMVVVWCGVVAHLVIRHHARQRVQERGLATATGAHDGQQPVST